jgi:hypothetical protein
MPLKLNQIPAFLFAFALAGGLLAGTQAVQAQSRKFNYDESKIPKYTLPDPLKMLDGTKVTTAEQWKTKRRPEVLKLFQTHVYGVSPAPPTERLKHKVYDNDPKALGGKSIRKQVTIYFSSKKDGPKMDLLIYLPAEAKKPVPCFLMLNFKGNHTINPDPGITINPARTKDKPGTRTNRWAVDMINKRGYGLATIYYGDIDPDKFDGFKDGIHQLFPKLQGRGDNFSSIAAWSWGLSRALDYMETDDDIDHKHVAVLGHSRLGKTSLWAGATDERFAMVVSNDSGCGGAALSRRAFGETVKRINTSFPHWFCDNYKKYNDKEGDCPVDQHMLFALMAPRPVYAASAEKDLWADPHGEFLSAQGADAVYRLLGTDGMSAKKMPGLSEPITSTIGYHIRPGKHDVTNYDWEQYLNFADKHFKKQAK